MLILGFDPGGKNAFGWAVLTADAGRLRFVNGGICSNAPDALEAVTPALPKPPIAVGIDAPLFWVARGDRAADKYVRNMVTRTSRSSSTVGHVNSLRGACIVQGVIVARLAQTKWPSIRITEAHPKALLAISKDAEEWASSLGLEHEPDHVRDAALAGYSAHALATNRIGWVDLVKKEHAPFFPSGSKAAYYFPGASNLT